MHQEHQILQHYTLQQLLSCPFAKPLHSLHRGRDIREKEIWYTQKQRKMKKRGVTR